MVRAQEGSDAAAVVFDALAAAKARGADTVIVDTAGRLHTRVNLMAELDKIRRIAAREVPGAPHEVLLVLDATVGQNGLAQAREFAAVAGVTGVVLTKLDGTAKGGVAVAIAHDLGLPIRYVGVGEGIDDLLPFSADDYVDALVPGVVVSDARDDAAGAVPRRRAASGATTPNPLVGAVVVDRRRRSWSGRAGTSAPAGRTPRCSRWPRPAAAPRGGTTVRHARAVLPRRPHRSVHAAHPGRRRRPGRRRHARPVPAGGGPRGRGAARRRASPSRSGSRGRPRAG